MTARKLGDDARVVSVFDAMEASRLLVNALCEHPDLALPELQPAIDLALRAFGLPQDFPERVLIQELNADLEAA